ncbi:MAG: hypothetical protein HYX77_01735 [Acidobacteria bacterium]|nr:hypothetical protein [Acidobacteriota bacterium]
MRRAARPLGGGSPSDPTSTKSALAAYLVLTLVATWPLAKGLGRDVAWDLGDPVLNMWILTWDCEQILGILGGDISRIATFFDANIFYPAPLTLAYSDHLIAQALQVFPVYLLSGNPILSYNLLFLSTFVLSGFGMYLLVRELTGNTMAAFAAGLMFAFAPYRVPQSSHVQVLSSQWMPFVVYGLTRYFNSRRLRPLGGAALALVLQNLSTGAYLLYFAPFAAAFVLWEIWRRSLWHDCRTWVELSCAGLLAAAATAPFLLPYAALRELWQASRPLAEVSRFSADVFSYSTAFSEQHVWGGILQGFPKPEGQLFPGIIPVLLAIVGVMSFAWGTPSYARPVTWLLAALAIGHGVAAASVLMRRRITLDAGWFVLRMSNINQLLLRAGVALSLLLIVSPPVRTRFQAFMRERGVFVLGLAAALWLSLGPLPQSGGRPIEIAAPYRLLYEYVPGFEGLRVPARFAMIVAFMLAVLAGYGAQAAARYRAGRVALFLAGIMFFLEATHIPFTVNGMTPLRGFTTPEARLYRPARAPAVYREMARQPPDSVVVELPIGQPDYDLRAMYYSTVHWRPVLNGYSGFFPPQYGQLAAALSEMGRHPEVSLRALRASGATHAIVHEGAYLDTEGADTSALLRRAGAMEIFREGPDVLFLLPR